MRAKQTQSAIVRPPAANPQKTFERVPEQRPLHLEGPLKHGAPWESGLPQGGPGPQNALRHGDIGDTHREAEWLARRKLGTLLKKDE